MRRRRRPRALSGFQAGWDGLKTWWTGLPDGTRTGIVVGAVGLALGAFLFRDKVKSMLTSSALLPGGRPTNTTADLHPQFRPVVEEWLRLCAAEGLSVYLTSTFRTPEQQHALWMEGRGYPMEEINAARRAAGMNEKTSQASAPLTNADSANLAKWSWHQVGAALDFGVMNPATGQKYDDPRVTGVVPPEWRRAVVIANDLGMRWGGDFQSIYDPVHLQAGFATTSAAPRAAVDAYLAGKLPEYQFAA